MYICWCQDYTDNNQSFGIDGRAILIIIFFLQMFYFNLNFVSSLFFPSTKQSSRTPRPPFPQLPPTYLSFCPYSLSIHTLCSAVCSRSVWVIDQLSAEDIFLGNNSKTQVRFFSSLCTWKGNIMNCLLSSMEWQTRIDKDEMINMCGYGNIIISYKI